MAPPRKRSGVRGAAKLNRLLRRIPDEAANEVRQAIEAAAARVYDAALQDMPKPGTHPYATGNLRRKFRIAYSRDGLAARIGSFGRRRQRAAHIHLVEFGASAHQIRMPNGGVINHPGAPAQPFLFPAYKRFRAENIRDIRAAVSEALRRVAAQSGLERDA